MGWFFNPQGESEWRDEASSQSGLGQILGGAPTTGGAPQYNGTWDPNAMQSWSQENIGRQLGQGELDYFGNGYNSGAWNSYGSGMDSIYNMMKQTNPEYANYQASKPGTGMGDYLTGLMNQGTISKDNMSNGSYVGNDGFNYLPNYYTPQDNQGNATGTSYLGNVAKINQGNILSSPNERGSMDVANTKSEFLDPSAGNVIGSGFTDFDHVGLGEMAALGIIGGAAGGAALTGAGVLGGGGASTLGAASEGYGGTLAGELGGELGAGGVTVGGAMSTGMPVGTALPEMGVMGTGEALAGGGAASAAGLTSTPPPANPFLPGASSGLSGITSQLGNIKTIGGLISALSGLTGGGGSSGGATTGGSAATGSTGGGLSDLIGLLGGVNDANQQGKAADTMKAWLASQQGKIDNLYNPGTPEYNALWDEMSRKDAAAGRNSQYGPRSVDLAARVAQIKADQTTRFTTGTSTALSNALNQNAARYTGLSSAAQKALAGGGITNLSSLISSLGLGNGSLSGSALDSAFRTAESNGQVQYPTEDYYNNPSNPTEDDVMEFLTRNGF